MFSFLPAGLLVVGRTSLSCSHLVRTVSSNSRAYDIVIVGGGIIGCATARELVQRHSKLKVAIVEKENKLGTS